MGQMARVFLSRCEGNWTSSNKPITSVVTKAKKQLLEYVKRVQVKLLTPCMACAGTPGQFY